MDGDIELISDGIGIAVIGDAKAVERFLDSEQLPSRDLGLVRLGNVLGAGAGVAQAGSELAANSGRWVKLSAESAEKLRKYTLMKGSRPGLSRAVLTDQGKSKGFLEIVKTRGTFASNPAMLAGAAGIMAQVAMQQAMDEITDYLAAIDEKVDHVLRAQKDAVFADMIGIDMVIHEAMTVRDHVGRVSEVTWSKVQSASMTIAKTQAYALRQLDALTEKIEKKARVGEVAKAVQDLEPKVQEWLAVLARCFQLQDAIAVLELDRVLEASPDELDRHRIALRTARDNRLELIAQTTTRLIARMDAAAARANTKVLLHPSNSPSVVRSSEQVISTVDVFHGHLGIQSARQAVEAKSWPQAAAEVRDKAIDAGSDGVTAAKGAAKRLGSESRDRALKVKDKVSSGVAERVNRRRENTADKFTSEE